MVFVAIFKIVDKSGFWGCGCSGRRGVVIGGGNLVGEGDRKYFVLGNLMMSLVICGGGYEVNLKFGFAVGV